MVRAFHRLRLLLKQLYPQQYAAAPGGVIQNVARVDLYATTSVTTVGQPPEILSLATLTAPSYFLAP